MDRPKQVSSGTLRKRTFSGPLRQCAGLFCRCLKRAWLGSPASVRVGGPSDHGRAAVPAQLPKGWASLRSGFAVDDADPDFMLAVEEIALKVRHGREIADRITKICSARGVPYKCSVAGGFEWVGDTEVRRELIEPALRPSMTRGSPVASAASSSRRGLSCAKGHQRRVGRRSIKPAVPWRAR